MSGKTLSHFLSIYLSIYPSIHSSSTQTNVTQYINMSKKFGTLCNAGQYQLNSLLMTRRQQRYDRPITRHQTRSDELICYKTFDSFCLLVLHLTHSKSTFLSCTTGFTSYTSVCISNACCTFLSVNLERKKKKQLFKLSFLFG